jgi:hypothetical protein
MQIRSGAARAADFSAFSFYYLVLCFFRPREPTGLACFIGGYIAKEYARGNVYTAIPIGEKTVELRKTSPCSSAGYVRTKKILSFDIIYKR